MTTAVLLPLMAVSLVVAVAALGFHAGRRRGFACPSCEVSVLDMNAPQVASRAKALGVRSVPAVVIDGKLADCCAGRGPDETTLRAAGLGVA